MNFFPTLTNASRILDAQEGCTTSHQSLYFALLNIANLNFWEPFELSRADLMRAGKIHNTNTIIKIVDDLERWGLLFVKKRKPNPSIFEVLDMSAIDILANQIKEQTESKVSNRDIKVSNRSDIKVSNEDNENINVIPYQYQSDTFSIYKTEDHKTLYNEVEKSSTKNPESDNDTTVSLEAVAAKKPNQTSLAAPRKKRKTSALITLAESEYADLDAFTAEFRRRYPNKWPDANLKYYHGQGLGCKSGTDQPYKNVDWVLTIHNWMRGDDNRGRLVTLTQPKTVGYGRRQPETLEQAMDKVAEASANTRAWVDALMEASKKI